MDKIRVVTLVNNHFKVGYVSKVWIILSWMALVVFLIILICVMVVLLNDDS